MTQTKRPLCGCFLFALLCGMVGVQNSIPYPRADSCPLRTHLPSTLAVVINGHRAAIEFNDRVTPGQIAGGAFLIGMLESPGDDLPPIAGFDNLPFGAVGPVLLLLQQAPGCRDLVRIAALRVLRLGHAGGCAAASAEQGEQQSENPASSHPILSAEQTTSFNFRRQTSPAETGFKFSFSFPP